LEINEKKIKYSLIYTNPFILNKTIVKKIKFFKTENEYVEYLCKKIFSNYLFNEYKITDLDMRVLIDLVIKKNKYSKYVGFEHSLLIYWFTIYTSNFIQNKKIYFDLLKDYYKKFLTGNFDFSKVIDNILEKHIYINQTIEHFKFNLCFYLLVEEFHFKYITEYFKSNKIRLVDKIIASNYVKINPQEILSNCNQEFFFNLGDLEEQLDIPNGHYILFFLEQSNKVYMYDPDLLNQSDFLKFKILFSSFNYILSNISNRKPIQVITDDTNCLFYCLRLVEFICLKKKKIKKFSLGELKKIVLEYETFILEKNDMFEWIITKIYKKCDDFTLFTI